MKRALATVISFTLGSGAVLGAAVAYSLLPGPSGLLAEAPSETTYPVTMTDFRDQRALTLAPTFTAGTPLRTTASGTVTATACTPGQSLTPGKAAFAVDDHPIIALASDTPFFRDLTWGDTGRDVDALRASLAGLGFDVAPTGAFSRDVSRALSTLQHRETMAHAEGDFVLQDVLWMPSPPPTVASCDVQVGQPITAGSTAATTAVSLTALTVSGQAAGALVPGERTVQVLGVDAVIPENGVLTDRDALGRIASSPEGQQQLTGTKTGDAAMVSGTSALATPLRVAPVPVSSVIGASSAHACVADDHAEYPVTVVGASLGMSLVTFHADTPSNVLLQPRREHCDAD
ncbi:hypothetical protein [Microbacterium sp. Kw_RZR3]|jgi:hypothetical protein|uniref:hypothetical protein n=1 Tax=unclassified Microbacterium TaxID=2609290 RepID=UPI0023DAB381|nr:hypothetical protein [Microbacterium sp. Kw_RZR3]MDF2045463.1 hypothetical protein [Microbacterium sp. Kw_RZR3]MDF2917186.1 hypothetical protein [Microbacterium sp.]